MKSELMDQCASMMKKIKQQRKIGNPTNELEYQLEIVVDDLLSKYNPVFIGHIGCGKLERIK